MPVTVVRVRNVSDALLNLLEMDMSDWRDVSPRGMRTMEHPGPVITVYERPMERVLFNKVRDANPFFHLMEALWILAGREDVEFLARYNVQMAKYSDDGRVFHAPYGHRLRHHFDTEVSPRSNMDQITKCINILKEDPSSRQAVMSIWDPACDLGAKTRDMPCNDMVFLKMRDGKLNMTVLCRSNDAIWGAYGANAVQFSMLQEFMASALWADVGELVQVSDSFHVYTENESDQVWKRLVSITHYDIDPYKLDIAVPYPLFTGWYDGHVEWQRRCEMFCEGEVVDGSWPAFFRFVALPMRVAWEHYRNNRIDMALECLAEEMANCDWKIAATQWLERRIMSRMRSEKS